jgi:hypothetical protein
MAQSLVGFPDEQESSKSEKRLVPKAMPPKNQERIGAGMIPVGAEHP